MDDKLALRLEETSDQMLDLEKNTLWKIKDYEALLKSRTTEAYMKDYVYAQIMDSKTVLSKDIDIAKKSLEIKIDEV